MYLQASFLCKELETLGKFLVKSAQKPVKSFDNSYFCTKSIIHCCEFHSYDSAADDDYARRYLHTVKQLITADHSGLINARYRRYHRFRTRRYQYMIRFKRCISVCA